MKSELLGHDDVAGRCLTRREAVMAAGFAAATVAAGLGLGGCVGAPGGLAGDPVADVARAQDAVSAFSADGIEVEEAYGDADVDELAQSSALTVEQARRYLEDGRFFGANDFMARAAVLCSLDELRAFGGYNMTHHDGEKGFVTEPNPAYAAYDEAFFEQHDLLVGQAPHASVSQAGYELAGACVQDGVAVMYARRLPDPWGMGTLDMMDKETFRVELDKSPGGYAGARMVTAILLVSPGGDGNRIALVDRGELCSGMRVEGALVDAGDVLGDWPEDPAASFSAGLGASGAVRVRGMRAGETWRVRVLSGGAVRCSGAVAVAPYGFEADGEVVFSTGQA